MISVDINVMLIIMGRDKSGLSKILVIGLICLVM